MSMIHLHSNTTTSRISSVHHDDIQPNAVDLRLNKVFKINDEVFVIDDERKQHRGTTKIECDAEGYYYLKPGQYDITMSGEVVIGQGEAGWLIIRSTFNRNGVFITSGLYDSGFSGIVGGTLHVNVGPIKVKMGTRIAQFLLFNAESVSTYSGDYGYSGSGEIKPMELTLYNGGE